MASYLATPGTTIRTEQHNPVFEDVASALSSVVLRDGRAPMTGALNMNGFAINNAVAGTSPNSLATLAQSMPIGSVIDYALKTPPAGWMLCAAQILLSNSPYQTLRTALINDGFPYGQDGSGNPKLPDTRGCVVAAYDAMGGSPASRLAGVFGAFSGAQSVVLAQSELPYAFYNLNGTPATISVSTNRNDLMVATAGINIANVGGPLDNQVLRSGGVFATQVNSSGGYTPAGGIGPLGSGVAHSNVQPTIIMNKIIRVSYDS